jgi:hypothetical protein
MEEGPPGTGPDWVFVEEGPPVIGPDRVSRPVSWFLKNVDTIVPTNFFFSQISNGDGKRDVKGTGVLCDKRVSLAG